MDAVAQVKVESDDEVEPYDGTYACGFCSESVRGTAALKCSQCSANPVHWACVAGTKYAGQCATCVRETMEAWRGASTGTAAPSEIIDLRDLEAEGAGAAVVAALTGTGAREDAVPAVGGAVVVAADQVGRGVQGGRADAGGGRSGKGKEPAGEEAAREDGSDDRATSAGAGAVGGGGGKGKERADNGSTKAQRGSRGGEDSGGGSRGGRLGHSGGAGGSSAAEEQRGEGSRKRAAPDADEGGSGAGGKRARGKESGKCDHNRIRSRCKECGGGSICQHARRRSECKECGGGGICQHARRRSRCKTCKADKDDSMPPGLEEL